jgi:putative tryptophan/tyrosine transport system substrate-binding protein
MQFDQLRRRELITLLGSAVAAWPLAARAQRPAEPVIGLLNTGSPDLLPHHIAAFRQALAEAGYVEGRNVLIDYRWASGRYDGLPALAAELVRQKVAVIVANGPAVPPAKLATATIPIVFVTGVDPVGTGLVASLNQPGANLTGVTTRDVELGPKLLEVLHQTVPNAIAVVALVNPRNPAGPAQSNELLAAAHSLGVTLNIQQADADKEFEAVFQRLARSPPTALLISSDAFFNSQSEKLAALSISYAVPAISLYREFPTAGGLMSYGTSIMDLYRQAGVYTGRILKGEKPAELPVQQATKVELIINLKTAKALGVTIPLSLLGRADQVIE